MRWFKHDSAANNDAKLKKVRIKYGMEGYGLYWYCLELIAGDVSATKITFELEHDAEIIAHDTGIHYERVNEMMAYMTNVGLFQQGENGIISCIKMAQRIDQSMTSNPDMRKVISKLKLNNHDSIMTPSAKPMQDKTRLDEIRIDKNIKPLVAVAPVEQKKAKRFIPPTQDEVYNQMALKGLIGNECQTEAAKFWHFYESKNWYAGKNKMTKWKSSVAGWLLRNNLPTPVNPSSESSGWSQVMQDPNFLES